MNKNFNYDHFRKQKSNSQERLSAISLFSGAGGMDIGFINAGFDILWANDFDKVAAESYSKNIGNHIVHGDINEHLDGLVKFKDIDILFGGPPCQGFSVAGKMALDDPRSQLVKSFMKAVEIVNPRVFVMENVKALGTLSKFEQVRNELRNYAHKLGYNTELVLLNAKNYGVAQSRERIFFVGFKTDNQILFNLRSKTFFKKQVSTLEAIKHLGPQGSDNNPKTCNAVVTIAERPVLRKSPYAGMLFNGLGRPLNPHQPCATLPASMGGNKTPIIDERHYYGDGISWVEDYHRHLHSGGKPYDMFDTPDYIRRLTLEEARILHSFPQNYVFSGGKSAIYRQIGNAVPCGLAFAVGMTVRSVLNGDPFDILDNGQLPLILNS